jgi:hypothetical protein
MIVRVDQKHITGAVAESACACPIARALREQYPQKVVWCVYLDRICQFPGRSYMLPPKAVQFMADFLLKKAVLPFSFEVNEE